MTPPRVAVEICVDDVAGALMAEREGADRIELCAALSEGGITPSLGLVATVLARLRRIGVQVMIRPRGGDFTVNPDECDAMLADIAAIRALPARPDVPVGFVFGALTPDRRLDRNTVATLKAACGPAPTTFHKAFDIIDDQAAALDELAGLGIARVLTSGAAATAEAGADRLAALVRQAEDRIVVLAGGGVRAGNARALVARTGVREIHLRAMAAHPTRPPVTVAADIAAVRHAMAAA